MKFIVTFQDDDEMAHMRQKHMAAHLAFLEDNKAGIDAAGPLLDADTGEGAGGLWVVEAASADAVHDLVRKDPFWPTGLRKDYTVLRWRQVYANGSRIANPE